MPEEAVSVLGGDRVEGRAHRLDQSSPAPGRHLAQRRFDLGEGLFYGVEVRRVGRQVQQLAVPLLDQLLDPFALVGAEVVHHHHLP